MKHLIAFICLTGMAVAQAALMSFHYSYYNNSAYDSANHRIVQTLVTQGNTTFPSACVACFASNHRPVGTNQFKTTGGQVVVGGSYSGPSVQPPSNQINYTNAQPVDCYAPCEYVEVRAQQIACSGGGSGPSASNDVIIGVAMTKVKTTVPNQFTNCPSVAICSNTPAPRCTASTVYEGQNQPCHPAHNCEFLAVKDGNSPWECHINVCIPTFNTTPSNNCTLP
jgi:hypothetical protein